MKLKSVANLGRKVLDLMKSAVMFATEYAVTVAMVVALAICVLKLPELHSKYLRLTVASKVYMIRDSYNSGGGTGFAVKGPSGQSYILTNDHVCDVSKDGFTVLVSSDDGSIRRRIIARDENSDLCLVEGLPGVEGLRVAMLEPSLGDILSVVGHPKLMPKHISQGEITGHADVSIYMGTIAMFNDYTGRWEKVPPQYGGIDEKQCMMNKHSRPIVDVEDFFFGPLKFKICVLTVKDAYTTAITIFPGNSGSPVVNFWGNVVGVAFASDNTNWGRIVNIDDINRFLKNY